MSIEEAFARYTQEPDFLPPQENVISCSERHIEDINAALLGKGEEMLEEIDALGLLDQYVQYINTEHPDALVLPGHWIPQDLYSFPVPEARNQNYTYNIPYKTVGVHVGWNFKRPREIDCLDGGQVQYTSFSVTAFPHFDQIVIGKQPLSAEMWRDSADRDKIVEDAIVAAYHKAPSVVSREIDVF